MKGSGHQMSNFFHQIGIDFSRSMGKAVLVPPVAWHSNTIHCAHSIKETVTMVFPARAGDYLRGHCQNKLTTARGAAIAIVAFFSLKRKVFIYETCRQQLNHHGYG